MGVLVRAACEARAAEEPVHADIEAVDARSDGGSDDSMARALERRAKATTFGRTYHASMAEYVLGPCNVPMGGVLDSQKEAATIISEDHASMAKLGACSSIFVLENLCGAPQGAPADCREGGG
jgi:hypothetical protein